MSDVTIMSEPYLVDIKSKIKSDVSYYGTVVYLNHLLTLSEQIRDKTKKNQIILKMFEHLIYNPTILIHVPFFRMSIIDKIQQIEEQINTHRNSSHSIQTELISVLRHSIHKRIKNTERKSNIMTHLNILSDEIDNYNFWVESIECITIMKTLRNVLEEIKEHPDYVV